MLFLIGAYSENHELFMDFRSYTNKKRAEYYFKRSLENIPERKIILCRAIPFTPNDMLRYNKFKAFIMHEGEAILGE